MLQGHVMMPNIFQTIDACNDYSSTSRMVIVIVTKTTFVKLNSEILMNGSGVVP